MILTDPNQLKTSCKEVSLFEALDIIKKLEIELAASKSGVGLAANQIGINAQVCIIRAGKTHLNLANPKIIEQENLCLFQNEGCLSFPDKYITTKRYQEIVVQDLFQPNGVVLFGFEAVVAQHECLSRDSELITEDGVKSIKEIVETKYSGKVLSCNIENNTLEFKKIIGWSALRNKEHKKWVRLKSSVTGPNKQLICTEDHKCAFIENIMDPKINFCLAKDMVGKYVVRRHFNRKSNAENELYNHEQLSVIFGSLLGDMCIGANGEPVSNHGPNQKKYAEFKAKILGGYTRPAFSGFRNSYTNTGAILKINEQTKKIREIAYTPNKTVDNILKYIDKISLAFWFMDDGCVRYKKNKANIKCLAGVQFHTEGFEYSDILKLSNMLNNKFRYSNYICNRNVNGNTKYIISLHKKSSIEILEDINTFIPECMEFKIPSEFRGRKKYDFLTNKIPISAKFIKEVVYLKNYESKLYNIEVENNKNYFADDTLVHNCDHLYGKTMYDFEVRLNPGDPCFCGSGRKFKLCHREKVIK